MKVGGRPAEAVGEEVASLDQELPSPKRDVSEIRKALRVIEEKTREGSTFP